MTAPADTPVLYVAGILHSVLKAIVVAGTGVAGADGIAAGALVATGATGLLELALGALYGAGTEATLVLIGTEVVLTTVEEAGQFVMSAAQLVMVISWVE